MMQRWGSKPERILPDANSYNRVTLQTTSSGHFLPLLKLLSETVIIIRCSTCFRCGGGGGGGGGGGATKRVQVPKQRKFLPKPHTRSISYLGI